MQSEVSAGCGHTVLTTPTVEIIQLKLFIMSNHIIITINRFSLMALLLYLRSVIASLFGFIDAESVFF